MRQQIKCQKQWHTSWCLAQDILSLLFLRVHINAYNNPSPPT